MNTITIRRNSFKKIASLLAAAKGVIAYSAHMQIDDSYDTHYSVSTTEAAMAWLKENQPGARVTLTGNELRICGPYWFANEYVVYLDEAEFEAAKAQYVETEEPEAVQVTETAQEVESAEVAAEEQAEEFAPVLVAANDSEFEQSAANDDQFAVTIIPDAQADNVPVNKSTKPAKAITLLENGTFYLESRGSKMTLQRSDLYGWEMHTDNASHRAYRGLGIKTFRTLDEVEKAYKSWRGISLLMETLSNAN